MRIIHVTESLLGGPSTHVRLLIEHQLALGWHVSIIADPRLLTSEIEVSGVEVIPYTSSRSPLRLLGVSQKVRACIKVANPDVVHLHGTFAGLYARILGRTGHLTVYCPHGWSFVRTVSKSTNMVAALVERALSRFTDATINVSQYEGRIARSWGITKNQFVILNSVREAASADNLFQPKPNVMNLGFVGRLDYQKGFDLLQDFMCSTRADSVHLWVAGSGYRDNTVSCKPAGNITYLGWLSNEQIELFMNSVDAIVIPSRWEGCPLVALEAMRSGKALLSSDCCGIPELIIQDYNGILYTCGSLNDMADVIAHCTPASLQRMGQHAKHVYQASFHPGKMLEAVDAVYLSLFGSRNPHSNGFEKNLASLHTDKNFSTGVPTA